MSAKSLFSKVALVLLPLAVLAGCTCPAKQEAAPAPVQEQRMEESYGGGK